MPEELFEDPKEELTPEELAEHGICVTVLTEEPH